MSKVIEWVAKIIRFLFFCVAVGIPIYGVLTIIVAFNAFIQLGQITAPATCTILEKNIVQTPIGDPQYGRYVAYTPRFTFLVNVSPDKTQRVEGYDTTPVWGLDVTGGTSESDAQVILDRFQIGRNYPCWYDPNNPSRAILTREYNFSPAYIFGALIALEVVVGIVWGRQVLRFIDPT
jgi:hypothetical protein